MAFLKSYFTPATKKDEKEKEKVETEKGNFELKPPSSNGGSGLHTPRRNSTSRPVSSFPEGDFRNSGLEEIQAIKVDVMVNWLYQQQLENMWTNGGVGEGVVLKKVKDQYVSFPPDLADVRYDLFDAVQKLNVKVSTTARSM
jgi:hypothetical protein